MAFRPITSRLQPGVKVYSGGDALGATMIAFGGVNGRLGGIPPFEFVRISSVSDLRRVFVRDPRERYYHAPIRGLGATIPSAARTIMELRGDGPLLLVGNSAGGYAALLFGAIVGADAVLAFSPLTTVRASDYVDTPFAASSRVRALNAASYAQSGYFDLVEVFDRASPTGDFSVVYPLHSERDRWQAERLRPVQRVRLRPVDYGAHNVVRHLRDMGALQPLLLEAQADAERSWQRRGDVR